MIDHIDDNRLDRLYRIGVDEISYKRGQKYLTIEHDGGGEVAQVVCAPRRSSHQS